MQCFDDKRDDEEMSDKTKNMVEKVGNFEQRTWIASLENKFSRCSGLCQTNEFYLNASSEEAGGPPTQTCLHSLLQFNSNGIIQFGMLTIISGVLLFMLALFTLPVL